MCQALSDLEQDIIFFSYDPELEEFSIVAGNRATIEVTIYNNGEVEVQIAEF